MDKVTLREAFKSMEEITDEIFDAFAQPEVKVVNKRKLNESLKEDINYNKELRDAYIALDDANIRFNVDKNVFGFYDTTDAEKAEEILIDIFGDDYVYNRGFDVVVYLDEYLSKDDEDDDDEWEDEDDEDIDESLNESRLRLIDILEDSADEYDSLIKGDFPDDVISQEKINNMTFEEKCDWCLKQSLDYYVYGNYIFDDDEYEPLFNKLRNKNIQYIKKSHQNESLNEDKLTEDGKNINLKRYGFVRAPEEDFTDDGNRFTCYYYDPEHNGDKRFRLSKLVDRGDVYISVGYTSPESRRTKYFDDLNGVGVDTVINGGLEKLVKDIEEFKKGIDEFNKVTRLNDEQVKQLADEIKVLMDRAGLEKYAAIKRAYHNLGIEYDTVPYEEKQKLDNYLRNTEPYNKEKLLQDVKEMIKDVIKEMTYYSTNYNRQYSYHNPKSPEEAIKSAKWHINKYPDAVQQRVIDHILKHLSTLYDFKDESYNRKLKEAISMKVVDKMAQEIVDELEKEGLIESCKRGNIRESRLTERPIYTRPQEPIKPDTKNYYKRELKDIADYFNKVFSYYKADGFIDCPKVTIEDIFNVYSPNFEHNNPANDNKKSYELTGANFYDRAINYLEQFTNWDEYVDTVSETFEDDIELEDAVDEGYLISKKDFDILINNDENVQKIIKKLIDNNYFMNDEENFVWANRNKKNYKGVKYVVSVYGDGVHYYDPTDEDCTSPDIEDAKRYSSKEDIDVIDIVADVVNANEAYFNKDEFADIFDCNSSEELYEKIENDDADFFINNGSIKIIPVIGNREIEESCKKISKKRNLKESEKIDIQDDEEIEKGKEILDNNKKADTDSETMKVVDVDAETVDKLKDSYIGNVLLQCPVCRTPIFKKPDLLTQDEENEELYNVGEQCPHCGSEDGFELVGQVASMDVETEEEDEETTGKQEVETEDNFEQTVEDEDNEETIETEDEEVTFESLDIDRFNNIANTYLTEVYSNVDSFTTTNATVDDKNNKLVIEGIIKYKSGKSKNTKFEFLGESIKNGKYIFKGLNETFAKNNKKAFTLTADIKNNTLISESLDYNYIVTNKKLNESKIVKGSTFKKKLIERIVYEVHSDVDENNVFNQFEGKGARKQAIDYAKKNGNCWVEKHWYEKDEDFDTQDPEEIWNYLDESKAVKGSTLK